MDGEEEIVDYPFIVLSKEEKAWLRHPWWRTLIVKLLERDDYKFAKFEGPWVILDHYLFVKEWTPNFDPLLDSTEKVLVWVQFPCKFARLCVELDITKPLLSRFMLRRRVRKIEYEGIYLVCFYYGTYGHRQDGCLKLKENNLSNGKEVDNGKRENATSDNGDNLRIRNDLQINSEVLENYGS
ncbi:hypothetical protein PTKIN_Ptkin04bG0081800 [Pterospermum kingtungense]